LIKLHWHDRLAMSLRLEGTLDQRVAFVELPNICKDDGDNNSSVRLFGFSNMRNQSAHYPIGLALDFGLLLPRMKRAASVKLDHWAATHDRFDWKTPCSDRHPLIAKSRLSQVTCIVTVRPFMHGAGLRYQLHWIGHVGTIRSRNLDCGRIRGGGDRISLPHSDGSHKIVWWRSLGQHFALIGVNYARMWPASLLIREA
jgi:hypothetical protein